MNHGRASELLLLPRSEAANCQRLEQSCQDEYLAPARYAHGAMCAVGHRVGGIGASSLASEARLGAARDAATAWAVGTPARPAAASFLRIAGGCERTDVAAERFLAAMEAAHANTAVRCDKSMHSFRAHRILAWTWMDETEATGQPQGETRPAVNLCRVLSAWRDEVMRQQYKRQRLKWASVVRQTLLEKRGAKPQRHARS